MRRGAATEDDPSLNPGIMHALIEWVGPPEKMSIELTVFQLSTGFISPPVSAFPALPLGTIPKNG